MSEDYIQHNFAEGFLLGIGADPPSDEKHFLPTFDLAYVYPCPPILLTHFTIPPAFGYVFPVSVPPLTPALY